MAKIILSQEDRYFHVNLIIRHLKTYVDANGFDINSLEYAKTHIDRLLEVEKELNYVSLGKLVDHICEEEIEHETNV